MASGGCVKILFLMKKYLLFAAAFLAFVGCEEKENKEPVKVDKISVTPESKTVGGDGGNVQVMVTSNGDWTLSTKDNQTYDWITADKVAGVDGDIVKFDVLKNAEEKKTAEFVFTCGKATAPFTVISMPGDVPEIILASDAEVKVDFNAGKFTVLVDIKHIDKDALTVTLSEGADWLTHEITLEGETSDNAKLDFSYTRLAGAESREAAITIGAPGAESVSVAVKQMPEPMIRPEQASYKLGAEAGTLEIPVEANVEYEITYSEGSDWLTGHSKEGNVEKWSYGAVEEGVKREAVITFTEKNPAGGAEPLTASVVVKQSNSVISTAAYMKKHSAGAAEWNNPDVLKLGTTLTIECLVRHDENFTPASGWDGVQIGTLFGLERRLLVRHGDNRSNVKEWELVYARNTKEGNGENMEVKVKSSKDLPAGEWAHIAVVFDGTAKTVTIYQNGEVAGSAEMHSDIKDIDLTETYTSNNRTQRFYLGRSYNDSRDFEGLMSEVRVWNKALSAEEINAEKHFYTVPADSEGLVAYWKMDDGQGNIIKDYTPNGNNLTGEVFSGSSWSAGMEWRDVDLP